MQDRPLASKEGQDLTVAANKDKFIVRVWLLREIIFSMYMERLAAKCERGQVGVRCKRLVIWDSHREKREASNT